MIPIVVAASGRGSNFDAIATAVDSGRLEARIVAVVSDQPGAPVLEKARLRGIPAISVPWLAGPGDLAGRRRAHEEKLLAEIRSFGPRFLVMAGYMRIVTGHLIESFRSERGYSRIVNIHPSILPAFPGINAYAQAYRHGNQVTGATVHLVESDVDSGPICAQETFSIADCRSVEEVEKRGLSVEHRLYPETLRWVLPEKFQVEVREGGRLCVRPN